MRSRIPSAKFIFAFAGVLACIAFAAGPNPMGKIEDFAVAHEDLISAKVVAFRGNRYTYYELRIGTLSGKTFYYREPDLTTPSRYLSQLPLRGPIVIRFRDDTDGRRILDVRDAHSVYIPFSETMAVQRKNLFFILGVSGAFALMGFFKLRREQTRRKPNQSSTAQRP